MCVCVCVCVCACVCQLMAADLSAAKEELAALRAAEKAHAATYEGAKAEIR